MGAGVSSRRPLIGVTTSEVRVAASVDPTPQGEPPRREMALGLKYLAALEAAGGLPVVLPPLSTRTVGPFLERLDGICLSGGPDLDPDSYGGPRHDQLGPTWPELDEFELELARSADELEMPILAICRGAQALNVARGGSLHLHLPDLGASTIEHRQRELGDRPTHSVEVEPRSLLARTTGVEHAEVNSFHHQAAKIVGRGLRAVAWAGDGVVEGLEARDREFVLGVQWHAEGLTDRPEQAALFSALVAAARRYPVSARAA